MNILMVLDKEFIGDVRVENEANTLSDNGYKVHVLCLNEKNKKKYEIINGVFLHRVSFPIWLNKKLKGLISFCDFFSLLWAIEILYYIKKHDIQILHLHDLYMFGSGIITKKIYRQVTLVGDLHENYVDAIFGYSFVKKFPHRFFISKKKWRRIESDWIKKMDYLIVVIEEMRDRVEKFEKKEVSVVANYLKIEEFQVNGKADLFTDMVYVGGLDKHRGIETLIKAVQYLKREGFNCTCKIVGGGVLLDELKRNVEKEDLKNNVFFLGWLPYNLIPVEIQASKIGIVPHLKSIHTDNTIPHKLFHYMYMKKPVIVSDCNPLVRIVTESKCGLSYSSDNYVELANSIRRMVSDKKQQIELGLNGNKAVLDKYNWRSTSCNLLELYKRI
ncbi:MAG: glycosyltransferase family 4 protein [Candidatus Cloacimonetes bacterium]|nr:glycosyltransferase family 4 protein [Candidatus Cloacimonadota bacterium]